MWPYWLLFVVVAFIAIVRRDDRGSSHHPLLLVVMVVIALMIGLRYEVGGDWESYIRIYRQVRLRDFFEAVALKSSDSGYLALNWFAEKMGGEIWLTNLFCGAIFSWGLQRLCRVQPEPWLALLVAIPYVVIVVAMGYSRQGVALGVLMAGLASVSRNGNLLRFAAYVAVAALFHRTAVVMFPLVALASPRSRLINVLLAVAVTYLFFNIFVEEQAETLVRNYIESRYSSQGALIRILMSFTAALLFFLYQRRLGMGEMERLIWRNFALASAAALVLLAITPSSTAIDRIALYLLPLQIVVLARIPGNVVSVALGRALVALYAGAVLFVWLNFAVHSREWLPYQLYPIF